MSNISAKMMQAAAGAAPSVPIEYMGSKSSSFIGNTSATIGLNLSGALSGGSFGTIQEGDFVLVTFAAATGSTFTLSFNSSGYTNLFDIYGNSNDNDSQLFCGYKIMGATPDASVIINKSASSQQYWQIMLNAHVYRYVDPINPIDATIGTDTTTASSLPVFTGAAVTTVTKNAYVIAIGANSYNSNTVSTLSWSGVFNADKFSNSVNGGSFPDGSYALAAYVNTSPGAVTPSTISASYTHSTGSATTSATIPLRPASP